MVMRPDPRMDALTRVKRRNFGPWWLWAIVVVLAGTAAYYANKARFLDQRLAETDVVTVALTTNNAGLRASVTDLERDVTAATARATKEHADAEAVSALLAKAQKRLGELQTELTKAQEAAAASTKEAAASKDEAGQLRAKAASAEAAAAQVQKLQDRIAAMKGEADAARTEADTSRKTVERLTAEATAAASAKSVLERELADLQKTLTDTRQKLEAATAAAGAAPAPAKN